MTFLGKEAKQAKEIERSHFKSIHIMKYRLIFVIISGRKLPRGVKEYNANGTD